MSEPLKRPDSVADKHLQYLDGLRESGVTNMFGAGIYLERRFGMSKETASEVLWYWMDSFSARKVSA